MKAIGALSISKDKRVTDEMTSDEQESENQTSMEIIESSKQSVGGDALLQSTTINQTCDQTCESQGSTSVRSRKNRKQSYMSDANIIEKRTRASKK